MPQPAVRPSKAKIKWNDIFTDCVVDFGTDGVHPKSISKKEVEKLLAAAGIPVDKIAGRDALPATIQKIKLEDVHDFDPQIRTFVAAVNAKSEPKAPGSTGDAQSLFVKVKNKFYDLRKINVNTQDDEVTRERENVLREFCSSGGKIVTPASTVKLRQAHAKAPNALVTDPDQLVAMDMRWLKTAYDAIVPPLATPPRR